MKANDGDRAVSVDFQFQNTSTQSVDIVSVTTSCGCTVATVDKTRYASGEAGAVAVIYHVGTANGLQSHTITVTSNEGADAPYVLTIEIELPRPRSTGVPAAAPLKPTTLLWVRQPYAAKTVTAQLADAPAEEDLKITCDRADFHVAVQKDPEKREATIVVTPPAAAQPGQGEMLVSWKRRDGRVEEHKVRLHILPGRSP